MSLRKFNLIEGHEESRKVNRQYMKAHRDEWLALGFRSVTALVHDSERDLMIAELDVRRCDRLIIIADDKTTDLGVLQSLASRNMPKPPEEGTIQAIREEAEDSTARADILATLDSAERMLKKQAALITLFGRTTDKSMRTRVAARGVAYSNAASARIKRARAVLDYAPGRPTAVFGIEGSAAMAAEQDYLDNMEN
jgi:hypothetical protein